MIYDDIAFCYNAQYNLQLAILDCPLKRKLTYVPTYLSNHVGK